jgi:16S rRNA (cytosine967-C5)-methyltransferase
MKIHRNLALGIVEGLHHILSKKSTLRSELSRLRTQNRKWGSRDRRLLAETILDCVRWQRTYAFMGNTKPKEKNYYWNLLGIWIMTKELELPSWKEFEGLEKRIDFVPLNPKHIDRKTIQSIPDWLDEKGSEAFGEEVWENEITALNQTAKLVLRANTLKTSATSLQLQLKKEFKIESSLSKENPEALVLDNHQKLEQTKPFQKGRFEIQDGNSQKVAHWVGPEKGMLIIDACAGSGGKSIHLGALMENKGRIIALDNRPEKLKILKERAKRNSVTIIETESAEDSVFFEKHLKKADTVLIDAPCSGLGVLKRNPAAKWHMTPKRIVALEKTQQEIIQKNALLVKPGGILVYSTCSIFPSENENQIQFFLESEEGKRFRLEKQETFFAHQTGFDGFFIAKMNAEKL